MLDVPERQAVVDDLRQPAVDHAARVGALALDGENTLDALAQVPGEVVGL